MKKLRLVLPEKQGQVGMPENRVNIYVEIPAATCMRASPGFKIQHQIHACQYNEMGKVARPGGA